MTNRELSADLLDTIRGRAAGYDAENRFFAEDFDDLRHAGYLAAAVPLAFGGWGLSLAELSAQQRRLAAAAPATGLGVNMHHVWVQVARFLHERGDSRLDWVLRDAAAGEVFAFGISEAGNDAVLMDANTQAVPDSQGGYRLTGTKIFTTLSPVWTRLGVHARDETGPDGPRIVHGFLRRDDAGISNPGIWNPLGMRATQSYTTRLEDARMLGADVTTRVEPFDGSDPLILGIFSAFSLLTASVYAGIGDRAIELAVEGSRRPSGEGTRLDDPDAAARLTAAVLEHRASLDALAILCRDIDDRTAREDWFLALAAAKNRVTDEARAAVDVAFRMLGARGFQADSELARMYRDVLAGLFHPSSSRALAATVRATLA